MGGAPTVVSIADDLSVGLDEHAQPFGIVHRTAHDTHELPHAHSGQITQHPVEPSLQLVRSIVSAAGNNQTARIQTRRSRRLMTKLYTGGLLFEAAMDDVFRRTRP